MMKSWEQQAVDEIIEQECREKYLIATLHEFRYLNSEWFQCGQKPDWLADKIDEMESELSDLQGED